MTCAWDLIILLLLSFSSSFFKSKVYRNRREAFNTSAACCKTQYPKGKEQGIICYSTL